MITIKIVTIVHQEEDLGIYGDWNESTLGGSLCTNHWASRPYWGIVEYKNISNA